MPASRSFDIVVLFAVLASMCWTTVTSLTTGTADSNKNLDQGIKAMKPSISMLHGKDQDQLGPYNISSVTVSGISSGGYFAVQMHIAYSSLISGAAIFAGVSVKISTLF